MMLYADLGLNSWGVFHVGLMNTFGISYGQATQVAGLGVLFIAWYMGLPPGLGTISNMYLIGFFIDVIIRWGIVPRSNNILIQSILLIAGMVTIGAASYFYLNPKLGAGPRDALMIGLVQKLDKDVSLVRTAIEITVLLLGIAMGGPIGIGTIITAFAIGYFVQLAFKIGNYDRNSQHMNLFELVKYLGDN